MTLARTPLFEWHVQAGARMVEFAGYEMPLVYSTIQKEHHAVRTHAGLFDVSHMCEFLIQGERTWSLLNQCVPTDLTRMRPGYARYTVLLHHFGGIVDDVILYYIDEQTALLVGNASRRNFIAHYLEHQNLMADTGCSIQDISEQTALIALQGPLAPKILQQVVPESALPERPFRFQRTLFLESVHITISSTGYTGSGGFELFVPAGSARLVWEQLLTAGRELGLVPAGLGARDTLRLEMGYPLYGQDIDESTTPVEANLMFVIHKNKQAPYPGKDRILYQLKVGPSRLRVGLRALDTSTRFIPRSGYSIVSETGKPLGTVTSGGFSPCLQMGIALAYLPREYAHEGIRVQIQDGRGRRAPFEVVSFPFLDPAEGCSSSSSPSS